MRESGFRRTRENDSRTANCSRPLVEAPENYRADYRAVGERYGFGPEGSTATCFEYDVQKAVQDGATYFGRERMACVWIIQIGANPRASQRTAVYVHASQGPCTVCPMVRDESCLERSDSVLSRGRRTACMDKYFCRCWSCESRRGRKNLRRAARRSDRTDYVWRWDLKVRARWNEKQ